MDVLLINGSPNDAGCTSTCIDILCNEFKLENIETEVIHIGSGTYKGCIACEICKKTNLTKCVYDDLCNTLISKVINAKGIIIGTPVYFASVNGTLKSLLDRVFFAGGKEFAYKPAASIAVTRRAGATTALDELNRYFLNSQMPIVSSTYWNVIYGEYPEDIKYDLEGMQTVCNLAKNMAWLIKCIEAAKSIKLSFPQQDKKVLTNFIRY